jgi:hypothetical protein
MVALLGQHGVNTFGLLDRYRLKEIHLRIDIRGLSGGPVYCGIRDVLANS